MELQKKKDAALARKARRSEELGKSMSGDHTLASCTV